MYIGIDVGGTNLVAGLVDGQGKVLAKATCPVDKTASAEELTHQLIQLSKEAAGKADCPIKDIQAIGAGIPGLVNNSTGVVIKTTNMPFVDTPFRAMFQQEIDAPVYLGNDADCAAIGEYWAGAAKGYDPALMVTLGTGIGGGMIKSGKLYTGFGGIGMEVGHLITKQGGLLCGCGNHGCWEQYGSATALVRMTREKMTQREDTVLWQLCGGDIQKVEGRTTFQAAGQGDEAAKEVLEQYLDELAVGLVNLANILFPEVICLGGGISHAEDALLLNPLKERVYSGCFDKTHLPKMERASLGNDAGVVGAAMLCHVV